MFKFFRDKPVKPELHRIGVDMHSHLLPGIDDGAKTVEETVSFISKLMEFGYEKLICTPHIFTGVHPNTPETIGSALNKAKKALEEAGINVQLQAAAEYMIDPDFGQYVNSGGQLLTFGRNYILVEMSYVAASPNLSELLFDLQIKDYKPILAHPERYNYYHSEFEKYEMLKDKSVMFQVNLLSLSGYYGNEVKKTALKLVDKGMVNFLATDLHHETHLKALNEFVSSKEFYKILDKCDFLNKSLLS